MRPNHLHHPYLPEIPGHWLEDPDCVWILIWRLHAEIDFDLADHHGTGCYGRPETGHGDRTVTGHMDRTDENHTETGR